MVVNIGNLQCSWCFREEALLAHRTCFDEYKMRGIGWNGWQFYENYRGNEVRV